MILKVLKKSKEGPGMEAVRTSVVATRMGKDLKYASVYRARLIAAGIIAPAGHGEVQFALPYLREYLANNAPLRPAGR